ncbi:TPA: hypothetical protein ACH3X3_002715 [Trebouxia sp. C0006]
MANLSADGASTVPQDLASDVDSGPLQGYRPFCSKQLQQQLNTATAQSPCVRRSAGQTAISLHLLWAADLSVSHPSILAKAHLYQYRAQSHVQQQAQHQPPHCRPKPKAGSSKRQGLNRQF